MNRYSDTPKQVRLLDNDESISYLKAVLGDLDYETLKKKGVKFVDIEIPISKDKKIPITLPYVPAASLTPLSADGTTAERDVYPRYVLLLQDGNVRDALISLMIEIKLQTLGECRIKHACLEAPIAVSAVVSEMEFMIDWAGHNKIERIIVNEMFGESRSIDADGDRGCLIFNSDYSKAVLLKWPITKEVPVLEYRRGRCHEYFRDLTREDLKEYYRTFPPMKYAESGLPSIPESSTFVKEGNHTYIPMDEQKLFLKTHKPVEVGKITSAHNVLDAWRTVSVHGNFWDKIAVTFRDPSRFDEIENKGMKTARKDHRDVNNEQIAGGFNQVLNKEIAWLLTGSNSITTTTNWDDVLDLLQPGALDKVVHKAANLLLTEKDFRNRKAPRTTKHDDEVIIEDYNLIERLLTHQRMRTVSYKHQAFHIDTENPLYGKNSIPMVAIYLTDNMGIPVALTDAKREDGSKDSLTYMYLLPPIWDAEIQQYVHPIKHMAKKFATRVAYRDGHRILLSDFDSVIINPSTGEKTGNYFGTQLDHRNNYQNHFSHYTSKATQLQKLITEYCGEYGYSVSATKTDKGIVPNKIAQFYCSFMVTVDYGRECNEQEMYALIKGSKKHVQLSISGNKQTNRRVRHYAIAHENGVAKYAHQNAHLNRPGKSSSQLIRSLSMMKMKTAIVIGRTSTQAYITPTGIDKQRTTKGFMPQALNTQQEYLRYCESHKITPLSEEEQITNTYHTWTGEVRKSWIVGARDTAEIGKLIDTDGNKLVPRRIGQVVTHDAGEQENIDLLVPIFELNAKGSMRALLGDNVPYHLLRSVYIPKVENGVDIGGQVVQCIVTDLIWHRTGSASENIPGRKKMFSSKGFDSFGVMDGLKRLNPEFEQPQINLAYPHLLIDTAVSLCKTFKISLIKKDEDREEVSYYY